MARRSASSRALTDHDEVRQWAEERDAKPTCVRGTGGREDVGMIRLDFPGYSGQGKLEEVSWDDWFDKFDESGLALLVQDETARGERSNFNKLVSRETAGVGEGTGRSRNSRTRARGSSAARRVRSQSGRGRSKTAKSTRTPSRQRGKATARGRSSGKKAAGRVSGRSSHSSRSGRSRKRAA